MHVKDFEIVEECADEHLHTGRLVPGLRPDPRPHAAADAHLDEAPRRGPRRTRWRSRCPERSARAAASAALGRAQGRSFPRDGERNWPPLDAGLIFDDFLLAPARSRHPPATRRATTRPEHESARRALAAASSASLPYALTPAQERVWREIRTDMAQAYPMNRLLQGDVGSGKTIVATLAILAAIESGLSGRVHGADRDPGRAAPHDPPAVCSVRSDVRVELLTNAVRSKAREAPARRDARRRGRLRRSAPTRWFRRACDSGGSASAWWTSSTASAWRSGRRCAARASGPTRS